MGIVEFSSAQGQKIQTFIRTNQQRDRSAVLQAGKLILDHKPSTVTYCKDGKTIIKLIKPRNWKERAKLFWGHSRVHKETRGARIFNQLGLKTPDIYEMGIAIPFFFKSEYIGYYVMSDLTQRGLVPVLDLFCRSDTSNEMRMTLLANICDGLKRLRSRNIVFTDFHLSNVFSDQEGNITWIDTGVSYYFSQRKMYSKLKSSVMRLMQYHKDFSFHPHEMSYIKKELLGTAVPQF